MLPARQDGPYADTKERLDVLRRHLARRRVGRDGLQEKETPESSTALCTPELSLIMSTRSGTFITSFVAGS